MNTTESSKPDLYNRNFNSYRSRLNVEKYSLINFIEHVAAQVDSNALVLDAGAGNQQYKSYFSHANYESTDIRSHPDFNYTFECSLDNIPKPDNKYDVVLCTQVLEHVEFPRKVVEELFRVLKPGGSLYLTAPQGAGVHDEPYHFFNFTEFGLMSIFKHAGFNVEYIMPTGGFFWYLGKRLQTLPRYISKQQKASNGPEREMSKYDKILWTFVRPTCFIFKPFFRHIVPYIFFYLDTLDKRRYYTLEYVCHCTKP